MMGLFDFFVAAATGLPTMALQARIAALVLCLACHGYVFHGSHHAVAFTTATIFRTPTGDRRHTAKDVEPQQQRTYRRRARPSSSCGRKSSSSTGSVWLSAVEGEDEEGDGAAGVYVATEALLDDPSYMERILASMGKLEPAVAPLEGVFRTAINHHTALRTSNVVRALKFYSLLGMKEVARFKAENARCAFLEGAGMRLELIEVPASMEPEDKAADLAADMRSTGLNHIAFDVGPAIEAEEGIDGLKGFLSELNRQSEDAFGMSVRLVVSPYEQRIGQDVFDLAFIMDADGVLLELLHKKDTLAVDMPQAW